MKNKILYILFLLFAVSSQDALQAGGKRKAKGKKSSLRRGKKRISGGRGARVQKRRYGGRSSRSDGGEEGAKKNVTAEREAKKKAAAEEEAKKKAAAEEEARKKAATQNLSQLKPTIAPSSNNDNASKADNASKVSSTGSQAKSTGTGSQVSKDASIKSGVNSTAKAEEEKKQSWKNYLTFGLMDKENAGKKAVAEDKK